MNIYGVDVFGRRKSAIKFDEKYSKINSLCIKSKSQSEDETNDAVLELLQSVNTPVLVNWRDKFKYTEHFLDAIKNKATRNDKRLLFYLSEAATHAVEFMTVQQIEGELFQCIYPLVGQYMCHIEEEASKDSTYSKLILNSLMRLLKQGLDILEKPKLLQFIKHN